MRQSTFQQQGVQLHRALILHAGITFTYIYTNVSAPGSIKTKKGYVFKAVMKIKRQKW